ncbi:CHAT domain-containing protein [Streptomyces sp. Root55]|uniref:CHAT domain-containing protein n=1 Tax=Streptomyces sp. Root55 TaxID=1736554 RepID=UPI000AA95F07|nr:CHAT domain-containing protein [Streptomyces sp. Root55]
MATTAQPSELLDQRIVRWQQGDPEGVLANEALIEAAQMWWVQIPHATDGHINQALNLLAWLHWARSTSGPQDERQMEQQCSLGFFRALWQREPAAPPSVVRKHFEATKPAAINDIPAHASGILRGVAVYTLTRHRDTGIRLFELSDWPPDLPADTAPVFVQVAMVLNDRHAETGDAADLDAVVTYAERALALATEADLLRAKLLQNVAVLYADRFKTTSAISDIDRNLALTNEALTIIRALAADPAELLANRHAARWHRFVAFQHLGDLRHAIADGTAAADGLPPGNPVRAAIQAQVARLSQLLALHPDNPDQAESGAADHVTPMRSALAGATGTAQLSRQLDLGLALAARFAQSHQIEDLQEAIGLFRENTLERSTFLLATALRLRYDALGDATDLDECIALFGHTDSGDTSAVDRITLAEGLADALEADYEARPDKARLHAAIDVSRTAVFAAWPDPTAPDPEPGLLPMLESLARGNLLRRVRASDQTGDHDFVMCPEAMTDAAYVWWLAHRLSTRNPASSSLASARRVLGVFHILRNNATVDSGGPDELAQTLMHWLPDPQSLPDDLPDPLNRMLGPRAEPKAQAGYANTLIYHANGERNPAAVNAAILLLSAAIEATPADDPQLPDRLGSLSDAYRIRGINNQNNSDLETATELAAEAAALAPPEAAKAQERLARARSSRLRFARRRATPDPGRHRIDRVALAEEYADGPDGADIAAMMDAAVQEFLLSEQAEAVPKKPATAETSRHYLEEFRCSGLAVDLELALRAAEVETSRHENPTERREHLSHLGNIHLQRYALTREKAELVEAARLLEEALDLSPRIGPFRGPLLRILSGIYVEHSELTDGQVERHCHLALTPITDALDSLTALRGAGRLALHHQRYDLAVTCYREAVALMRVAALEEIDQTDRAARLSEITETGSEAVTAHILAGDPATALEAAEEARAVVLTLELDLRTDLTSLREARPDLAERFDRLRDAITADRTDSARIPDGYVRTVQASQSRTAWTNLLADIRAIPGYERFMRPPVADELTTLNLPGPLVLINVSPFGSHALVVDPDPGVRVLPLDGLNHQDVHAHAYAMLSAREPRMTSEILAWLWETVVGPVLEAIGPATRVWWVPTGLLSAFPLHAATAPDGRSAIDLIESSYAPTIRLLTRGLARAAASGDGGDLVVAVRRTANGAELAGAEAEGRALLDRHPEAVPLLNEAATRESVLAALPRATRAYFACHNVRDDVRPHRSGLGLFDGLLTIDDLSHLDLPHAEFAQLSACATVMPTPDAPDELTHLAAAFQLAGFRSVVATLWPVRDLTATEFTQLFHAAGGHITTCTAVTSATRALRDRHPDHPELWAPYLHYGL